MFTLISSPTGPELIPASPASLASRVPAAVASEVCRMATLAIAGRMPEALAIAREGIERHGAGLWSRACRDHAQRRACH